MKLSEAIRTGRTFRPESHQERFARITNTEELRSDPWGAACEAVHSLVAKRTWSAESFDADMAYLNDIQHKFFGDYFKMPAICPGAYPRAYSETGVKIKDRHGNCERQGRQSKALGPVTDECLKVVQLAGLVDHLFYAHNWTSEQVADAVEWYENRSAMLIVQNFDHYQDETLRRSIGHREVLAARQREIARRKQATGHRTYAH